MQNLLLEESESAIWRTFGTFSQDWLQGMSDRGSYSVPLMGKLLTVGPEGPNYPTIPFSGIPRKAGRLIGQRHYYHHTSATYLS